MGRICWIKYSAFAYVLFSTSSPAFTVQIFCAPSAKFSGEKSAIPLTLTVENPSEFPAVGSARYSSNDWANPNALDRSIRHQLLGSKNIFEANSIIA
jgi:hypothetical protein